jgi:hypothetical protein
MTKKQQIAIVAPLFLVVMMTGVFQAALWVLKNRQLAWYAGFLVYWPVWCILFPWLLLGRDRLLSLFRASKLNRWEWGLFVFPPALVLIGVFIHRYDPSDLMTKLILVFTSFTTGTLEEVLWRGVYIDLFPKNRFWGLIWPTIGFALWHFAPGTVSTIPAPALMGGALVVGACWSLLAYQTGTVRWSAISHILTGLARSLG